MRFHLEASSRIKPDYIKNGLGKARNAKRKYLLRGLSEHHQLIYGIIQDFVQIKSGELWNEYLRRCKKAKMPTAAPRTFNGYVRKLEELDLILGTRALGVKGNVRTFTTRGSLW